MAAFRAWAVTKSRYERGEQANEEQTRGGLLAIHAGVRA